MGDLENAKFNTLYHKMNKSLMEGCEGSFWPVHLFGKHIEIMKRI